MPRQNLFSISPDTPFLATLSERILDGTLLGDWPRQGAFWLSDVTIILPTQRARFALARSLATRLGGTALLPDIRTFGGEPADEEPFLPPFDAGPMPQAVSPLSRTLTLARLVEAWARSADGRSVFPAPPGAAEILALAQSLGSVIDDFTIEGGSLAKLNAELGRTQELAENWRQTRALLEVALTVWPELLQAENRADAAALRNIRLRQQAKAAAALYGERPVIAAGSTGSIAATADLLAAIAALPRGAVVLPGLDTTLSRERFEKLLTPAAQPHGHPQYALAKLLRRLGSTPAAVEELSPAPSARTAVVRSVLALASDTADWLADQAALGGVVKPALDGIAIIAARTVDDEARGIAVAARAALAEGRSVGIVSPDQTLSRRIAEELKRFDIEVDDAAGTPLFHSAAGRLARLALNAVVTRFGAVDLMALLQNRGTALGLARREVARRAGLIELALLRGQRPAVGLGGLRALLAHHLDPSNETRRRRLGAADGEAVADLLDRLEAATAPLGALFSLPQLRATDFAAALLATVESIVAGAEAALPGMEQLRRWGVELETATGEGPVFPPLVLDAVLRVLMSGFTVTSPVPRRDDIAIWGRLEARLMNPELMVLAGLNEEVWPEPADPGPWLSRDMRLAAGLEPPERLQGQAAHDFEMGIGNHRVILAYAERRGTSPALPSRLLQRLGAWMGKATLAEVRARGDHWLALARSIDLVPQAATPASRPLPLPPAAKRPRKLSVTEIETLFRSPYDLYAKHVLRLRKLPPLGEAPGARERGSMIHEVFDRFVSGGHDFTAADAKQRLMAMAEDAFAGLDAIGERRDIWLRRFERAAAEFLHEQGRGPLVRHRHAEVSGRWTLTNGFVLTCTADRIDELADGTIEILDFKTGSIPTPKTMKAFEAPQLLLEAAMAEGGAFAQVPAAPTSALTYLKVGLGPKALSMIPFKLRDDFDLPAAANEVARRLQSHADALLMSDARPMAAQIRPDAARRYTGDYDHLARTDEWTIAAGEDE